MTLGRVASPLGKRLANAALTALCYRRKPLRVWQFLYLGRPQDRTAYRQYSNFLTASSRPHVLFANPPKKLNTF
nr:hypothetical protein [Dendronalium sp. ChiSLP03b]